MKELYIAILEEQVADLMDKGLTWEQAYEIVTSDDRTYNAMRDRLADMADRMEVKE